MLQDGKKGNYSKGGKILHDIYVRCMPALVNVNLLNVPMHRVLHHFLPFWYKTLNVYGNVAAATKLGAGLKFSQGGTRDTTAR